MSKRSVWMSVAVWLVLAGCGKGTPAPQPTGILPGPPPDGVGFTGANIGAPAPGFPNQLGPIVHSEVPPAPINGGTLLVAKDGTTVVAADPDRDRISIVDLGSQQVMATVPLQSGDEPGRMVEDAARRVHVVLRSKGELATIQLDDPGQVERRAVCPVPQGIAYDPKADSLYVACTSGELVTLPAAGGPPSRSVHVDIDLRDVLVSGDRLFVTRFKSAELLELDATGAVISRRRPGEVTGPFLSNLAAPVSPEAKVFQPAVAWRTVLGPDGSVTMLHQRDQVTPIALSVASPDGGVPEAPDGGTSAGGAAGVGAGGAAGTGASSPASCTPDGGCVVAVVPPPMPGAGGDSAYGSSDPFSCDSIVHTSVTRMADDSVEDGPVLPGVTLAVDAAISPDGATLALAVAGSFNSLGLKLPPPGAVVLPMQATFAVGSSTTCPVPGLEMPGSGVVAAGQVVAVAFDGMGRLVMQTRDPNQILVIAHPQSSVGGSTWDMTVDLGGAPRRDTGHDLFHTNAGAGLACASCHPGGGDDGRAWDFAELGPRRTQLFNMGIRDTLPLHWDGELATFDSLIQEVFERRMGGPQLPPAQIQAMSDWIDSLHPNAPMLAVDDPSVARGRALFESSEVGCSGCHNGAKLTDNASVDVGTGGKFQVPSLIGVAYHQPYLHTGCAQTLRQRFDPACGGSAHGNTAGLSEDQIGDLVAYLQSL